MTAADLKVRLGRAEPALHDFESLLGKLRPDSWLYREVRRKIEDVFLRNDDQAGLATYYERWVKQNPDDVEALVRLGRSLAAQGRIADAQGWYEKAVKLAPSRRDLRLALIGQLAQDQKFAEAAAQYEALDRAEPNNPDTLRDWGGAGAPRHHEARGRAQGGGGRDLAQAAGSQAHRTPSPSRRSPTCSARPTWPDDALALYRQGHRAGPEQRAVPRIPRRVSARAEASRRGPGGLGPDRRRGQPQRQEPGAAGRGPLRLRLHQAGDPAADPGRASSIATTSTSRMKLAELLHRAERYDDARARLDAADKLAENDEEKGAVLEARIKNDQAAGQLDRPGRSDLRKELEAAGEADRGGLVAAGSLPRGRFQASRGGPRRSPGRSRLDPRSIPAWTLAARLRESAGNLADAADAYRRLAEIDRRNRTEYLTAGGQAGGPARPHRRGPQGGPRPDRRRAGQPRALRVLRRALLPARQVRRGPRRPPPRRAGQPERHQDPPDPGRDPRRPVPHR